MDEETKAALAELRATITPPATLAATETRVRLSDNSAKVIIKWVAGEPRRSAQLLKDIPEGLVEEAQRGATFQVVSNKLQRLLNLAEERCAALETELAELRAKLK